uniref:Sialate O-acetylesterase domain-containing protein n=1 Tax=Biomphalaria glabrata TaxID=6526 RepID=A0A2C9LRX1_BIOGL
MFNRDVKDAKVAAVTFAFAKQFQNHMVLQRAPQRANIYGFSPTIGQKVTLEVDGAAQEIADAHNYNIRVMTVGLTESSTPLYDLAKISEPWSRANNSTVGHFSAVCWLFGKNIYRSRHIPIGLVATSWGGTPIKAWSSPLALVHCGLHHEEEIEQPQSYTEYVNKVGPEDRHRLQGPGNSSVLWNSMIHPLLGMTIYGAIWYQGESDSSGVARDKYNCTFPTMIKDWRSNWNRASNGQTSNTFPFGFVQLAPNHPSPGPTAGFADIRWHQTVDRGDVPNPDMPNVFMAVAMDLPDFNSPYG